MLEPVCGFDASTGTGAPGSNVAPAWGRRAVTGEGEDYVNRLTDSFTRELVGKNRYVTVLFQVRMRNVLDETTYWTMVANLRNSGRMAQGSYDQLLDRFHAHELLNDLHYSRRSGRDAPASKDEPLPQVAERGSDRRTCSSRRVQTESERSNVMGCQPHQPSFSHTVSVFVGTR